MFYRFLRIAAGAFLLANLAACAAVTTGTDQSIAINTEPAGASCKVKKEGAIVGEVQATPGAVRVDKGFNMLQVACSKEGYDEQTDIIDYELQGATFGNIILGGGIGVIIDAASGAMAKYPESHSMLLFPTKFASKAEAEEFHTRAVAYYEQEVERRREDIKSTCNNESAASQDKCKKVSEAIDQYLADKMADLDDLKREKIEN